ncbi:response regulator transcription factor [Amycolatopsis sp. NPDC051071]|uniref:response regulator transcription factor n=1 Tax=Amycolatopsis sp. NPDC051071 TaxID=3154637 RepID=UPI003434EB65
MNDSPQQAAPASLKVFVLDDHELLRYAVRMLLESEPDIEVIGEAATAAEAIARIPALKPDVAILDIRLPDGDGISVCREVRSFMEPPPACLMLTSYSDDDALFGAIMAGAAGYMLKQVSSESLLKAVRTVAAGGSLLDSTLTTSVIDRLRDQGELADPRYAQLSPQERRVLDCIADGLTNRQIGERLYLSKNTVKNYVSSVLRKLGVERRTAAAVYGASRRKDTA